MLEKVLFSKVTRLLHLGNNKQILQTSRFFLF